MQLKTLEQLIKRAQRSAGLRGDRANTHGDWTDGINDALAAMHAEATKAEVGYYDETVLIAATPSVDRIQLPADHFITRMLLRTTSVQGQQFEEAERVDESSFLGRYSDDDYEARPGVYWYRPSDIVLRPVPTTAENIKLAYVKAPPVLANNTDTVDMVAGWDEFVAEYAAGYAHQDRAKRERHIARADSIKARLIAKWGDRRDRGPRYVRDSRRDGSQRRNGRW